MADTEVAPPATIPSTDVVAQPDTPAELAMRTYTAVRDRLITMDATIMCDNETYAKITTAKFSCRGSITLQETQETYEVNKQKPYKGILLFPQVADDTPIARAWRDGILGKSMHIVVGGALYRMVSAGFLSSGFTFYRVCSVPFAPSEESETAKNFVAEMKNEQGVKIGELKKDGFFKKTYTLHFALDVPDVFPAFALWLSTMFDREDAAVAGAASGAGAF